MPGSSEYGSLKSLQDISLENNRVSKEEIVFGGLYFYCRCFHMGRRENAMSVLERKAVLCCAVLCMRYIQTLEIVKSFYIPGIFMICSFRKALCNWNRSMFFSYAAVL